MTHSATHYSTWDRVFIQRICKKYRQTHCNSLRNTLQLTTHMGQSALKETRCNTTHHTATQRTTWQHNAPHCNTIQPMTTYCNTLNTLQHTATHCNTLQHTATHCKTLQHTTAHGSECLFNEYTKKINKPSAAHSSHRSTLQHNTVNAPACLFNEYTTTCHNGFGKPIFLREKTTENWYPIFGIPKNGIPIFLREKATE